jgi:hypothetical protein
MRRQQHIEFALGQPLLDEGQITGGVIPQSRATVKFRTKPENRERHHGEGSQISM